MLNARRTLAGEPWDGSSKVSLTVASQEDQAAFLLLDSKGPVSQVGYAPQEDVWGRTKRTGVLRVRRAHGGPPILNGQYVFVRSLGAGAYGRVKLVLNLQDMQLYAVKAISKRTLLGNRRVFATEHDFKVYALPVAMLT